MGERERIVGEFVAGALRGNPVHLQADAALVIADALVDLEHCQTLLRAVASYDAANQSDLPLGLLDQIRDEVGRQ